MDDNCIKPGDTEIQKDRDTVIQKFRNSDAMQPVAGIASESLHDCISVSTNTSESLHDCISVSTSRQLLILARQTKAKYPNATPLQLQTFVRDWQAQQKWQIDFESAYVHFLNAYSKVKFLWGKGPVDQAYLRAKSSPVDLMSYGFSSGHKVCILAALCRELQKLHGTHSFPLSCATVARLFGLSDNYAWKSLNVLLTFKIIKCTLPGNYNTHRAAEYLYQMGSPEMEVSNDARCLDNNGQESTLTKFHDDIPF